MYVYIFTITEKYLSTQKVSKNKKQGRKIIAICFGYVYKVEKRIISAVPAGKMFMKSLIRSQIF